MEDKEMNKTIYMIGLISINITFFGAIFKMQHWPHASLMLTIGLSSIILLFLPLVYVHLLRETGDKSLKTVYHTAFISFFINLLGILFKIESWPNADLLLSIGIIVPFILFLPIYINYHNKRKLKPDKAFFGILFTMVFISISSSLLAINISRDILDSFVSTTNQLEQVNYFLEERNKDRRANHEIEDKCQELIEQISSLRKEIALSVSPENKQVFKKNSMLDAVNIKGKDRKVKKSLLLEKGGVPISFISNFEYFEQEVRKQGYLQKGIIPLLVNQIKENWKTRKPEKIKVENNKLISVLNRLTEIKNKLLLIQFCLSNEEETTTFKQVVVSK